MRFKHFAYLIGILTLVSCGEEKTRNTDRTNSTKSKPSSLFQLLSSSETGITFNNNFSPEKEIEFYEFQYQFNGGGVGIGDFNNDGLKDVFFCGNEVDNHLYLNKGELKFEEIAQTAGVQLPNSWCNGVTVVDINNDGFLDLYVSKGGFRNSMERKNALLINNGDLTFTDQAEEYGIADTGWSTQSIFFDFDNDNDLDLYVLNHPNHWGKARKMSQDDYKRAEIGADHFYINENGKFMESSKKVGLKTELFGGYGLGIAAGDLNQDGYIDLYISNDYDSPDFMYINQGDGTFKEEVKERTTHIALYSMGSDIADFNNDGLLDILALDMSAEDHFRLKTQMGAMAPDKFYELVEFGLPHQYMYNTLQLNNGNGTFSDIGQMAGIHSTDWSWSPLIADFDNDGNKDIIVTNGYRLDDRDNDFNRLVRVKYGNNEDVPENLKRELFTKTPSTPLANYAYKNNGQYTFSKKTYEWGLSQKGFSQGAAFADLDNDGDLELLMSNIESEAWLYENKANELETSFLNIELEGTDGELSGAMVRVTTGDLEQTQQFQPTRGYMSSSERTLHFGIPQGYDKAQVEVQWKNGMISNQTIGINQTLSLSQKNATNRSEFNEGSRYFADEPTNLGIRFKHHENKFDDFEKEILLPHRNSQHGPSLAVGDLNGDGLEDIFIGGAHNQAGEIYFQSKNGELVLQNITALVRDKKHEDLGALIYDYDGDGDNDLYVASGGNEFPEGDQLYSDRLYINNNGTFNRAKDVLPQVAISGKSVSAADYDNDGDLDLFVGGRLVPGKYPFPPKSMVLNYENGVYTDVTAQVAPEITQPGLVTNSQFVDFDGDNDLDLVIVGEWMPIMFMENDNGTFKWRKDNSPAKQVGWWSGLASEDVDNDGDLDFIVGNLGLNYKYKATDDAPFQIWCHDFDDNGSLDIVLGYYDHGACYPVRGRQCSSQQMPFIKQKFPTYNEFANATIKDVYGDKLNAALNYQVNNFSSVFLRNDGNGEFAISQLPAEAQFSMVTSVVFEDVNKDSKPDAILAGNLYTAEVETPRADASIGVTLVSDGNGGWTSLNYPKTGLYIKGDTKDMKMLKSASENKKLIVAKNNTQPQVISLVK